MKMRLCTLLFSPLVSAALAGGPPPFSPPSIDMAPLGLIDGAKNPVTPPAADLLAPRRLATAKLPPKMAAPMPIMVPRNEIDPRMVITPPSGVDYKLRIKVPDVGTESGGAKPGR